MTRYLVVPAAGQSKRFPNLLPKFLLQHPEGVTMLEKSITSIGSIGQVKLDKIVVVSTSDHFEGIDQAAITSQISNSTGTPCELVFVSGPTKSVIDTLTQYFESLNEDVEVVIKDADNLVRVDLASLLESPFALAFARLSNFPNVPAPNKSFLEIDSKEFVTNFVEKQVISDLFSVGMVRFFSVSDFLAGVSLLHGTHGELYISDLVRALMNQGFDFRAIEVEGYEDWGTLSQWLEMKSDYATLFLDVDGVLVKNASPISKDLNWDSFHPIKENIDYVLELQKSGKVEIIFTTSRASEHEGTLKKNLEEYGFENPRVISGLYHARRALVNDFAITNPFPSASAINLERNATNLADML